MLKNFLTIALITTVSLWSQQLIANQPDAHSAKLSLLEVYQRALERDNTWLASLQRFEAAKQAQPIARADLLPSISLGASHSQVDRDTQQQSNNISRQYGQTAQRLQLRQPILNLERVSRYRMSLKEVDLAELELAIARQDLAQRTVESYFDLFLAHERLKLTEAQIQSIEAQMRQAEKLREGGVATLTDVHEAKARLDRAIAERIEANNDLEISRRALSKIIGSPVDIATTFADTATFAPPAPNQLDEWVSMAIHSGLIVDARKTLVERAALNQQRTRNQHLPTLDLVASLERNTNSDIGNTRDNIGRIGVELNIPLFLGGKLTAQDRQAVAQTNQAEQEWVLAMREAELEASSAFTQLTNSLARIQALEQAVRSAEVALEAAEISFSVAYRTFIDVLNAQQLLFSSRFDLLRARFDYVNAVVRLNSAVGSLDDTVVEQIDLWLDKE